MREEGLLTVANKKNGNKKKCWNFKAGLTHGK
jgi:hypothetical protein